MRRPRKVGFDCWGGREQGVARQVAGQNLRYQGGEGVGAHGLECDGIGPVFPFGGFVLGAEQGEQNEGQGGIARVGSHGGEQIEAALHGHELIGQHEVHAGFLRQLLPCFVDAAHGDRLVAGHCQLAGEAVAAHRQILDEENAAAEPRGSIIARIGRVSSCTVTQKLEPRPDSLRTPASPPINSARRLTMERPRPLPP